MVIAPMVSIENNVRLTCWLKSLSRWDGWLVALGGGIVLLGWSFGNEMLKCILPGLVAMNPVTALGFIFAGASLMCYWLAETKPARTGACGRAMACVLVVIGTLKLGDYIFGWHLAFDQMLFRTQLRNDGTGFTNQIAPNTAFNFILSGLALWSLNSPVRRFSRWSQDLSLVLAFASLLPLVGYIYRASYLYSIGAYIPMALHTATLFFLLALGLLLAQTDSGVVALFISKTPGGEIARRLLPFAFAVPILLGALTLWMDKKEIYAGEFGITFIVVGSSAIFTGLIWWNAILLNRADYHRREAEEQLQKAHDHLELRVQERTAMLNNANTTLQTQIVELQKAEEKIREQAEQMLRAQRMESIGNLAGGIAHDLNNALTPIIVGTQLLKDNKSDTDRNRVLDMIFASASRSAAMVKHILAFARGSKSQTRQVPLSHLVKELTKIVHDTFPKSISINTNPGKELWNVSGDTTELYQVLLNLCVNARDAMPQGGQLTLNVENLTLGKETKSVFADIPPGDYMVLSVADTGTGIPPEVLPRIFEPFFSTKAPDRGTGLGLSTVAGIIKNHNGFIQIHSQIGQGTEFRIYLPASKSVDMDKSNEPEKILPVGHGELILLMDDEVTVRQLAQTTLQHYGYRVVTAMSGLDGITTFEEYEHEVKLLVSDTDMPLMNGIVAIRAIQKLKPEIPVIITSGAQRDENQLKRIDTTHLTLLEKPYTVEQLLNAVAIGLHNTANAVL
jgi:signal transduction histidine kinase/ActR/RegA family two-component response regulator